MNEPSRDRQSALLPNRGQAAEMLKKSLQLVAELGVEDLCEFQVLRDGNWFVLDGRVDSQSTKTELLSLVPEIDGASWIVDRIRIAGRKASGPRADRSFR